MGIGKMVVPLFLSTLPEGMTFTIASLDANTPSGMYTYNMFTLGLPHTYSVRISTSIFKHDHTDLRQASDISSGATNNKRGAKLAELTMACDGAFNSGTGGSYLMKFMIKGRPTAHPEMPEAHISGTLTVSTSDWGTFSRPDTTHFNWTIDGVKPLLGPEGQASSNHGTFSASTPYLGYLEDSCITVLAIPDKGAYAFGVANQQDLLVKVLQLSVPAILAGHVLAWGYAAGWVIAGGAGVVKAVVWVAEKADKIHL